MDASSPAEAGPSGVNANNQDEIEVNAWLARMNATGEIADRRGREWVAQRQAAEREAMPQPTDVQKRHMRFMESFQYEEGTHAPDDSFSELFAIIYPERHLAFLQQKRQEKDAPQGEEVLQSEEAPRPQSEEAPQGQPADVIVTEGDGDNAQQEPAGVTAIDDDGEGPQPELESGLEELGLDPDLFSDFPLEPPQQGPEMMQAQQGMAPAEEQAAGVSATDTPVEQWPHGVPPQPEGSLSYQQEIGTSGWPLGGHQAPLAAHPEDTVAFHAPVGIQQGLQGTNPLAQEEGYLLQELQSRGQDPNMGAQFFGQDPPLEPQYTQLAVHQPGQFNHGYQYGTGLGHGQFTDLASHREEYNNRFDLPLNDAQAQEFLARLDTTTDMVARKGGAVPLGRFLEIRDCLSNKMTGSELLRALELLMLDAADPKSWMYLKKPGE